MARTGIDVDRPVDRVYVVYLHMFHVNRHSYEGMCLSDGHG